METGDLRRSRCRQLVEEISLYFHIPFCTKKCPYCHFYVIPNRTSYQEHLATGLAIEWEKNLSLIRDKKIVSIYFGGGTPSLFNGIGEVLGKIPYSPDAEITIEANPEETTLPLFEKFRSLGINRLSLGVQSLDQRSLETLERIHSAEKAIQAILDARKAGFQNISIDLMYDLPDQSEESLRYTLDKIENLPITHLSLYNLTIEPHTAFHKRKVKTPANELSYRFLNLALEKLDTMGLKRYEISAFSKEGFQSKHNTGYWTARPFLGFGPSAFSYWEKERYQNIANLNSYVKLLKADQSPVLYREKLPPSKHQNELLAVELRLLNGVNLNHLSLEKETLGAIEKLKSEGLLRQEKHQLQLTEKGLYFYDTVASEII